MNFVYFLRTMLNPSFELTFFDYFALCNSHHIAKISQAQGLLSKTSFVLTCPADKVLNSEDILYPDYLDFFSPPITQLRPINGCSCFS